MIFLINIRYSILLSKSSKKNFFQLKFKNAILEGEKKKKKIFCGIFHKKKKKRLIPLFRYKNGQFRFLGIFRFHFSLEDSSGIPLWNSAF